MQWDLSKYPNDTHTHQTQELQWLSKCLRNIPHWSKYPTIFSREVILLWRNKPYSEVHLSLSPIKYSKVRVASMGWRRKRGQTSGGKIYATSHREIVSRCMLFFVRTWAAHFGWDVRTTSLSVTAAESELLSLELGVTERKKLQARLGSLVLSWRT